MNALRTSQRGLTLTELMVAIAVSLMATLAIFQTFAIAEGHRRTATSGGDAAFNGIIGINLIQRDLRGAGAGLNAVSFMNCVVQGHDHTYPPGRDILFRALPVVIDQGAGNAPDTITIAYSASDRAPAPIKLAQNTANPTEPYRVNNPYGIVAGDLMIAFEAGKDCSLFEVTATPSEAPAGEKQLVKHVAGATYKNRNNVNVEARFNKPGGLGINYTINGALLNLGPGAVLNRYYLNGQGLVVDQALTNTVAAPAANNVVQLQAQYGIDANNNDQVEDSEWTTATPAVTADWTRVLSIRVGIAVRSSLPERPDPVSGNCDVTTASPTWAGGTLDITADANWRCYRYRVFETTTTLRNLVWQQP